MPLFVPTPQTAARIAEEFAEQPLGIDDLCSQLRTRAEIVDAMRGRRELTPRRVVRLVFEIVAARRKSGLPPYSEQVIRSVVWLFTTP